MTLAIPTAQSGTPVISASRTEATGPGGVALECPSVNNTYVSIPDSTQRFQRFCEADFNGNDGSLDITRYAVRSFTECMTKCVQFNLSGPAQNCTAVSWRWQGLPGTDYNFCWLKYK